MQSLITKVIVVIQWNLNEILTFNLVLDVMLN